MPRELVNEEKFVYKKDDRVKYYSVSILYVHIYVCPSFLSHILLCFTGSYRSRRCLFVSFLSHILRHLPGSSSPRADFLSVSLSPSSYMWVFKV